MERLRDREPNNPIDADAATLLRAAPAQPPSPTRQRLIRASGETGASSPMMQLLRPALGGAVLGSVVLASVMVIGTYREKAKTVSPEPRPTSETSIPEEPMPQKQMPPAETREPAALPPKATTKEPRHPVSAPKAEPSERKSAQTEHKQPVASNDKPVADQEESLGLLRAATALRREHDPALSLSLLDQYLRRYPKGALLEEALALAIEAALEEGSPRAAGYAERYLAKFPDGRFTDSARRARGK